MARAKRRNFRSTEKRVMAKMLGRDHINVWTCSACEFKWDRVSDERHPWIICPNCKKSGTVRKIKEEKI